MSLPYKVIATYRPTRWRASLIGRDLTDLTAKLGYTPHIDKSHGPLKLTGKNWCSEFLHAEVRRRTFLKATQAEGPHWDGDLDPNADPNCLIVTWASNNGTQIKWRDGTPNAVEWYQPRPYEVVVFDNTRCLHRRPPNCPRVRWMFRQRVAKEQT